MDSLWSLLARGYAEGESWGAFRGFQGRRQSEVRVLCGLVLGQRIAFQAARHNRAQLFEWLNEHAEQPTKQLLHQIVGADVAGIVWYHAQEDAELSALKSRAFKRWSLSHLPRLATERIINIAKSNEPDLRRLVAHATLGTGIGKWTQKAFGMICLGQDHLLYEDLWINKRWSELCLHVKDCPKSMRTLQKLHAGPIRQHLTFRQLSFLLWRITPIGIRLLVKQAPLPKSAFLPS